MGMKKLLIIPLLLSTLILAWCSDYTKEQVNYRAYALCWNDKFLVKYKCTKQSVWRFASCAEYSYDIWCFEYYKIWTGTIK